MTQLGPFKLSIFYDMYLILHGLTCPQEFGKFYSLCVFLYHCISDMGMLFLLHCIAGGCTLLTSWKSIRKKYYTLDKVLKFTESSALFTHSKVDLQMQVKAEQVLFDKDRGKKYWKNFK